MATYSFFDMSLAISGPSLVTTLGGGTAAVAEEGFTPTFEEDVDVMTQGADGSVMHSLVVATRGTIEIHLLKTSAYNAVLNGAYRAQFQGGSSVWAQNTISIFNPISGDLYICTECAFRRHPANPYQMRGNILTWTFNVSKMDPLLGSLTIQ